jgi:hypothetical protein
VASPLAFASFAVQLFVISCHRRRHCSGFQTPVSLFLPSPNGTCLADPHASVLFQTGTMSNRSRPNTDPFDTPGTPDLGNPSRQFRLRSGNCERSGRYRCLFRNDVASGAVSELLAVARRT